MSQHFMGSVINGVFVVVEMDRSTMVFSETAYYRSDDEAIGQNRCGFRSVVDLGK